MDAKALAKSKRAHTLHHKKKHQPHQAPKAPAVGSDDKNPSGKVAKEGPLQSHAQQAKERPQKSLGRRPLPSNWGRYDEDFDLGTDGSQASSSQLTEIVVPKSKGADYAYLFSEAKAQSQVHYSPDAVPLFEDLINDFTQDFGPMLAAKGKNILSWIADESFEFEDKTSTSLEVPFLSLNLNSLAKQVSKAKLSERLYLDPDLLPLELLDDEQWLLGEDRRDSQNRISEAESDFRPSSLNDMNIQHGFEPSSSTPNIQRNIPIETFEGGGSKPTEQNTDKMLQPQGSSKSSFSRSDMKDIASVKQSKHESAGAEAELDMLLSLFGETNIVDSSPTTSTSVASGETILKGIRMMDDDIDKLLEETSKFTITEKEGLLKAATETTMDPVSKSNSKLLDDFDSWLDTI